MNTPNGGGNCFDMNGRTFLDHHKDSVLVHGVVINALDKKPMGHCWIERSGELEFPGGHKHTSVTVIDKSNGNDVSMPQAVYYYFGQVGQTVKYTIEEFRKKIVDTGHWGPWELECDR